MRGGVRLSAPGMKDRGVWGTLSGVCHESLVSNPVVNKELGLRGRSLSTLAAASSLCDELATGRAPGRGVERAPPEVVTTPRHAAVVSGVMKLPSVPGPRFDARHREGWRRSSSCFRMPG